MKCFCCAWQTTDVQGQQGFVDKDCGGDEEGTDHINVSILAGQGRGELSQGQHILLWSGVPNEAGPSTGKLSVTL